MKIVFSSGHGLKIRGASGYLDEVNEARKVVERVAALWRQSKVEVVTFHDDTSTSQSQNLNTITSFHNKQTRDYDVSCHFNAYQTTSKPMGTEVLYVTQSSLAAKVSGSISGAGGFLNRGAKKRTDLAFLNNTNKPAILLEVCFVDSSSDRDLYNKNFEKICVAIAESISGVKVPGAPVEPPVEPPPIDPPIEPETDENRVDISSKTTGNVLVVFNGQVVSGDETIPNKVKIDMEAEGDVLVTINGEDFHSPFPGEPPVEPPVDPVPPSQPRPTLRKGDKGPDVVTVQQCLSIPADGDFGSQTDAAVRMFQLSQSLTDDGVVGQKTWAALERVYGLPPYVPPQMFPPMTQAQIDAITRLAASSPIASYSWKDRGRAPAGYTKGIAVAYGMCFLKYLAADSSALEMGKANTGNDAKDAISWYNSNFAAMGMRNDVAGTDTLRHLFVLIMGLGMRESSGKHCEGRDQSASNTTSDTAEAGLYQQSWNSHTCSGEIDKLFDEYKVGLTSDPPQCALSTFKEGVSCSSSSWSNYGSGTGRDFQQLAKSCPQFCVEAAAVGLRNLRQHWGPINRKDAELRADADALFIGVQEILASPTV
jgi:peptidoglycan hydrolase-like protein with peptidoglycan-binding domain